MAAGGKSAPATNGTHASGKPIELAIGLPHSPGTRIHLHLTVLASSVMLFLTSASIEAGQSGAAMGSFVYAMPDRYNPRQPLSTALYTAPSSLDFATGMAKALARKTMLPCYVGSSINLTGAMGGGSVEEEMEAFHAIMSVVTTQGDRAHSDQEGS